MTNTRKLFIPTDTDCYDVQIPIVTSQYDEIQEVIAGSDFTLEDFIYAAIEAAKVEVSSRMYQIKREQAYSQLGDEAFDDGTEQAEVESSPFERYTYEQRVIDREAFAEAERLVDKERD